MSNISRDQRSLFNNLLNGKLLPKDTQALIEWLGKDELDPAAAELITSQLQEFADENNISPEVRAALDARLANIIGKTGGQKRKVHFLKTTGLRYAAAIIILFGAAVFFFALRHSSEQKVVVAKTPVKDIQPGGQGAVLTLDDGTTVVLDSLGNRVIANQNGSKVLLKDGQLVYDKDNSADGEISFNTMTTPKGRQFQLVLPDGSKVWLNAASSIRYPTVFAGKERKVEVTGEAYFEVTKNANMPFKVEINDETEIQVLGTHFNINSYKNEADINTTLLEGSVQVVSNGEKEVIKPGQQAQVANLLKHKIKIVSDVNLEKVMAWKNGVFNFEDATLEEVMRQLERWYDIEVVYEKNIPQLEFMGKMSKNLTLSEVLRGLELSKVHFRVEGRKLVVLP